MNDILISKQKKRKESVVIGFRLDADIASVLEKIANDRGMKASTAAGIIVADYIEKNGDKEMEVPVKSNVKAHSNGRRKRGRPRKNSRAA